MVIRGIIFDCFGVLYHGSVSRLLELAPAERHVELFDVGRSSDYGYISRTEYLQRIGEIIGKTPEEVDELTRAQHVRNESLFAYVRELKQTYRIALLSNVGRDSISRLFTPEELAELFDVTVLSSDVHMVKPNPEIFAYTAAKLGLAPGDCLMIDDLEGNIQGAEQAGMHGIVFTTTDKLREALAKYL